MASASGSNADELTSTQQEALDQYMAVTNQDAEAARALLQRSNWSVPIAIAKFFDGDDDDATAQTDLHDPAPHVPQPPVFENLQESLYTAHERNRRGGGGGGNGGAAADRTEPARRIVPPPPNPVWRPPLVLAVLLSPLHLGYRLLAGLWGALRYLLGFLPPFRAASAATAAAGALATRKYGRRQLSPRDAAARFKMEFQENYGTTDFPFVEEGYAQAYDKAKKEPMLLLVVLLSPEHDDTDGFVRETLLAPEVLETVRDPANNILVWGGNVRDSEAYQVAAEFQCTKFPFSAVISVTPKEGSNGSSGGGNSTRMGTVKRLVGRLPPAVYATHLRAVVRKYADDLAAVRAERISREASRNLRAQQDEAYERSLARDRERARQRRAEEAAAAEAARLAHEKELEAERQAQLAVQWRRWRLANTEPEPAPGTPDIVRVALKMPQARGGERIRRSFAKDATVEDLYAFVECHDVEDKEEEKPPTKPKDYTHQYKFRIASVMPREVHEPSENKTLLEAIGKSASLVVEELEEDSDEE